jgi:two-component system CheB/CheR fusion protein
LIYEQLEAGQKNLKVKIFATDIDDDALKIAGKGHYSDSISKNITPERLEKYFTKDPHKGYKIKPVIREILIFAHHDLIKNPPYCNMDFISCRNMLIYINPLLQKRIVSMLHFGLKYGGYLFLGPSENVLEISEYLQEIDRKWKIYKNIQTQKSLNFDTFLMPTLLEGKEQLNLKPFTDYSKNSKAKNAETIDTNLLIDLGYAGVLIDKNNQVVNVFGNTQIYLINKMFVHHLDDLLVKPLQVAFTTARMEADKQNKLIAVKDINVKGIETPVTIKVQPLTNSHNGAMRLVLFCHKEEKHNEKDSITFNENFYSNKYTVNIEEELLSVKEKLTASNELLNASNENMQSFNEELLSANEEMQSTNEEMQSVNEELQTINAEYQSKIRELSELNDDLNNYFRSNVNGQIFVDKDLMLMKFSPAAATHINVRESDVGRPLSNISTNIQFETIDTDIREVLLKGTIITKEIQAIDGKWYQVMTMPYVREKNKKADGAIITFNDISELKKIQKELSASNKSLKAINTDLDNFVYTASHDLLSPINNIDHIVYMIRDKVTDEQTREYTDLLSSSVTRFRSVINEMATIGKIESDMLHLETINLEEMVGDIIKSMQWKITSENADIQVKLEVKEITFSKKNCRSMIFNLLSNALKFRSPERSPKIIITTTQQEDSILISVKDNGIGIDKNRLESIFKMYKRLNTEDEGQGLGLFLIKKIIDAAGGSVAVESEPGIGSEFKLFIKK